MPLLPLFDPLYCQEDNSDLESPQTPSNPNSKHYLLLSTTASSENWSETLTSLTTKAHASNPIIPTTQNEPKNYLTSARTEAIQWLLKTVALHNFTALTALLAVNYLDRCFLGHRLSLQDDKPWMGQLAAVACLSLAAKVEETRVPLPVELQLDGSFEASGYLFEPKSVGRMELLVLSELGWRMNPVTALSFVEHVAVRLCSNDFDGFADRVGELFQSCEFALLAVLSDCRWVRYPASVWAVAALRYVVPMIGLDGHEVYETIALLDAPMEKVQECYQIMLECMALKEGRKRRSPSSSNDDYKCSPPPSPTGVISSCFSCDTSSNSSGDLWAMPASPDLRPSKLPCIANNRKSSTDEEL